MTDFEQDPRNDAPAGDHPDRRSPDVEGRPSGRPEPDEQRDVEGRPEVDPDDDDPVDSPPVTDPESPGQTIDDPVVAEPNEPA